MKRRLVIFAVCALLVAAMPLAAFAHGHGYGYGYAAGPARSYSLCDIEGCASTAFHYHGEAGYYGHYLGDGHDYHPLCDVSGCELTGIHAHGEAYCFGHYAGDGHSYHNSYGRYGGGCHRW